MARVSRQDHDFDAISPDEPGGSSSRWRLHALRAAIIMVLGGLILPVVSGPRCTRPREMQCRNNLRNVTLGLIGYKNAHGDWPPPRTFDAQGRPLHSWRTLILPYIDQQELFQSIDLSKPWDDPVNAKAAGTTIPNLICPNSLKAGPHTNYLAVLRKDGSWILDSSGRPTILLMDVDDSRAVPWMSTFDATEDTVASAFGPNRANNHDEGVHFGLSDARIVGIAQGDPETQLPSLLPAGR